jgi:hypothetical protein
VNLDRLADFIGRSPVAVLLLLGGLEIVIAVFVTLPPQEFHFPTVSLKTETHGFLALEAPVRATPPAHWHQSSLVVAPMAAACPLALKTIVAKSTAILTLTMLTILRNLTSLTNLAIGAPASPPTIESLVASWSKRCPYIGQYFSV